MLSISTAGKNRYLFHFNSLHSLTQWTAAIRLAMFENASLQEAYTGSLIAGKGKLLNNIKVIMDRTRIRNEDWARVRFGAGTPWRRCWCVITPPDEKEVQKQQKQLRKKSAYERSIPSLKGSVKFYDTKKTKKAKPIATINDAYSAYAMYPQSKALIDQSTLVKVEGNITIHATPETTTEGFLFVMPEVHPAVTGFEMLLRFLFPLYDVFALYGRPNRLIADTLDARSLMFALPQEKRYGYLEILDVATLIHEVGSQSWSEREWRKRLKDLTSQRMKRMTTNGRPRSRASSYRGYRSSVYSRGSGVRYEDIGSIKSTPSLHHQLQEEMAPLPPPHKSESAPPTENGPFLSPQRPRTHHQRSFSETSPITLSRNNRSMRNGYDREYGPSRLSQEQSRQSLEVPPSPPDAAYQNQAPVRQNSYEQTLPAIPHEEPPPLPPTHGIPIGAAANPIPQMYTQGIVTPTSRSSSDSDRRFGDQNGSTPPEYRQDMSPVPPPVSVNAPPAFSHEPGAQPRKRPGISPELRRENSRLSVTTLSQLVDAGRNSSVGNAAAAGAAAAWRSNSRSSRNDSYSEDQGQRGVMNTASRSRNVADRSTSAEGMVTAIATNINSNPGDSGNDSTASSHPDSANIPYYKDKPLMNEYDLLTPQGTASPSRNVSPLSQTPIVYGDRQNPRSQPPAPSQTPNIYKPLPPPAEQQRPQASRSSTSLSISRKPVPSKTPPRTSPQRKPQPPTPKSKLSTEDLQGQYIDEDALAQVLNRQHTRSLTSESKHPVRDDVSSMYDNDSNISPDYASTAPRKSTETRRSSKSIERPRRGILKTVGTVEPEPEKEVHVGDFTYKPAVKQEPAFSSDIPVVDFGPTQAFNPASSHRPTTSGTMTQAKQEEPRPQSRERMTPSPAGDRSSKLRSSPGFPSNSANEPYERAPSRNLTTPEPNIRPASSGSEDDNRRSMAWQPGTAIGAGSPGARASLTPEQFVQQRAAANRVTPIYAHGHKNSTSPTAPNASRQVSGEATQRQRHTPSPVPNPKRQSSYGNELPARPHSRAASTLMNASGDYAAHLSAREQEHVARMTGTPLITMAGNPNKSTQQQGSGLVGAIEAREKEKREMKEGVSGHMVQHAIAQRQQHDRTHQARQASYSTPNPQYAMPGGFPPSPVQQHPSHAANTPTQQYGWPIPSQPQYPQQPEQYLQYQAPQPQYQQPPQLQRQWTPPSAGSIYGGHQQMQPQQMQPQQQMQYPPPPPQQQQQQQGAYYTNHQQQQQQAYYGPYYGNGQPGR